MISEGGDEYDAVDHRTILGGRRCGTNLQGGIDMAGVDRVTRNNSEK